MTEQRHDEAALRHAWESGFATACGETRGVSRDLREFAEREWEAYRQRVAALEQTLRIDETSQDRAQKRPGHDVGRGF